MLNKKAMIILEENCVDNDGKSTLCGYNDMDLIVVCERIMQLQPAKKMNLMINENFRFRRRLVPIVDAVLEEFEQTYHYRKQFS